MTVTSLALLIGIAAAIFVVGVAAEQAWMRRPGEESKTRPLLTRRLNVALSVFFTLVALTVSVDLIVLQNRFNHYVDVTLPRDAALEKCNTQTITVLEAWVQDQINRDRSVEARDEAELAVLDRLIAAQQPNLDELVRWRVTVENDRTVRAANSATEPSLPTCLPAKS